MGNESSSGIIVFLGGLLTLISLFLGWFLVFQIGDCTRIINGFGQYTGCLGTVGIGDLTTAGNVMLIGSIIVLLMGILFIIKALSARNAKSGFVVALLGSIVCLIGFILYAWNAQDTPFNLYDAYTLSFGFFLAIIGIVISLAGSYKGLK
ncbi:MAG: hypothetical protein RBG13Loki_3679 [Promethearchaeota archaeon CR_4]|nr:MAG: hypothetical protein RBG13Loki_3679 [Candidatus Lokiarchaeota archaeon CR_4]